MAEQMQVEVVYALPKRQSLLSVNIAVGSTVRQAIERSGILTTYSDIDLAVNKVGIWSRTKPDRVLEGFDRGEFDAEGRYIRADFGNLSVISLYLPSGSSSPERQEAKFRFLDVFFPQMLALRAEGREIVLCGDWNIAHQEIDLKNWKSNQKNSGFLPEERAWLSRVFAEQGWVDVYRHLFPATTGDAYTWWSNRGQAWAKNVGWRIDYQIATPGIATTAQRAEIYKAERFSDHAPLIIDYEFAVPQNAN